MSNTKGSIPKLYPNRELDEESEQDPEQVLRWAGSWLSGDAAVHGELLRAAADIVAERERAMAELVAFVRTVENITNGSKGLGRARVETIHRAAVATLARTMGVK